MKEVDRIAKDVSKAAENVSDDLITAVHDLAKEVRKLTRPEPRMAPGLVALVALAVVALVVAIIGGAKLNESRSDTTEPYA